MQLLVAGVLVSSLTCVISALWCPSIRVHVVAIMDEIITSGSVAAASHSEFGVQSETMDIADDIGDEIDDAGEKEGDEEAVEVESEPVPKKERKRRRAVNDKPAEPRVKWTSREGECLDEAWKTVSIYPITDANENTNTYWGRIKTAFDECKLVDPDFAKINMDHRKKAMANCWSTIQTACNKWHGIVEEVVARPESGATSRGRYGQSSPALVRRVAVYFADMFCSLVQMVRMFDMYHVDNEDQEFRFLHVFSRIESCEKWRKVWLALDKAKETYNPYAPASRATEGRPDGTKKARAARDSAPAAEWLQSSIEQCIADVKNIAAKREETSDARWSALMANQHVKLDLLRTNDVAKKRNNDLAFLMGQTHDDEGVVLRAA
ncbi:putative methionyl-tRNA synthetase [Hordeum vulgare]|nr:putative methionyl-tRNA synthetase [Hordeum vulgare]